MYDDDDDDDDDDERINGLTALPPTLPNTREGLPGILSVLYRSSLLSPPGLMRKVGGRGPGRGAAGAGRAGRARYANASRKVAYIRIYGDLDPGP